MEGPISRSAEQIKFLRKVDIDFCWRWKGTISPKGYGRIEWKGKGFMAHRLSYELFKGKIPKGMCCCHHCDNKWCVRPTHLWIGTIRENNMDMMRKGRHRILRGESSNFAKLNESKVSEIRKLYSTGIWSYSTLAGMYSVRSNCIYRIVTGETWRSTFCKEQTSKPDWKYRAVE